MEEIKAMTEELIMKYSLLVSLIKTIKLAKKDNNIEQVLKLIDSIEVE